MDFVVKVVVKNCIFTKAGLTSLIEHQLAKSIDEESPSQKCSVEVHSIEPMKPVGIGFGINDDDSNFLR